MVYFIYIRWPPYPIYIFLKFHIVNLPFSVPARFQFLFKYPYFNPVQSQCMDTVLRTDCNMVIGAPTGSGKTGGFTFCFIVYTFIVYIFIITCNNPPVVAELAMVRVLNKETDFENRKPGARKVIISLLFIFRLYIWPQLRHFVKSLLKASHQSSKTSTSNALIILEIMMMMISLPQKTELK